MKALGIFALLIAGLLVSAGSVSAFGRWEGREDMVDAIEANDYDAWKNAWQNRLTEDRFNEAVERHQMRDAMHEALAEEDYEAWREAIDSLPRTPKVADVVNEDNFDTFVEMHEAREAGDHDEAEELAEELGLGQGMHKGRIHGLRG